MYRSIQPTDQFLDAEIYAQIVTDDLHFLRLSQNNRNRSTDDNLVLEQLAVYFGRNCSLYIKTKQVQKVYRGLSGVK